MPALTSRAIQIDAPGGPEAMQLRQIEVPEPGPGEVRVAHRAVGLNSRVRHETLQVLDPYRSRV